MKKTLVFSSNWSIIKQLINEYPNVKIHYPRRKKNGKSNKNYSR